MISEILKQQTGYELANPCQTVTRWVKAIIDELVEEEMGSGTEVERNDFKTAVETFAEQMKIVASDIDDSVKTRQQKIAENLEAARLENSLIFEIDDEPIPGIDAPERTSTATSRAVTPGSSIALAPRSRKRKQAEMDAANTEPSADAVLFTNSFREATASLAGAFRDIASQRSQPSMAASSDTSVLQPLKQRIDQIEASIERMTDAFQSTSRQAREESEAPAMHQRMDRMEESMGRYERHGGKSITSACRAECSCWFGFSYNLGFMAFRLFI